MYICIYFFVLGIFIFIFDIIVMWILSIQVWVFIFIVYAYVWKHKYIFYFAFICLHVFLLCVLNSLGVRIFRWARFQVIGIDTDKDMEEERT